MKCNGHKLHLICKGQHGRDTSIRLLFLPWVLTAVWFTITNASMPSVLFSNSTSPALLRSAEDEQNKINCQQDNFVIITTRHESGLMSVRNTGSHFGANCWVLTYSRALDKMLANPVPYCLPVTSNSKKWLKLSAIIVSGWVNHSAVLMNFL